MADTSRPLPAGTAAPAVSAISSSRCPSGSSATRRCSRCETAGPLRVLATLMLRRVEVTWMSSDTLA
jgi:hypothetical protein